MIITGHRHHHIVKYHATFRVGVVPLEDQFCPTGKRRQIQQQSLGYKSRIKKHAESIGNR